MNDISSKLWYCTDTLETFLLSPSKQDWENVDILYQFEERKVNKQNKVFRKYNKQGKGKEIACFGCSNTFGVGLPDEWTWPYKLNELFGFNSYNVKNYGVPGSSIDSISIMIYDLLVNKNKDYEAIFIFFPDTFRYRFGNFSPIGEMNYYDFVVQCESKTTIKDFSKYCDLNEKHIKSYLNITNESWTFFKFVKFFNLIKEACRYRNIPFYCYSWSYNIIKIKENVIDFFIDDYDIFNENQKSILHDLGYSSSLKARDDAHLGKEFNSTLAKYFYEAYNKKNN
jgi:hypothetical protein